MGDDRSSSQPQEQTNFQQQSILHDRPHPILTANDGNPSPPPVPPRAAPSQTTYPSTMGSTAGMFGYPMNPYTMNQGYGGYGGFMPGGGYGNPMLGNGNAGGVEDVSRNVFETVGGVVQTLSSVSVMLQSTLFAVQNSVQAVLSVAHQFGHLRNHIVDMCLSTIRIVKYYYRKLLHLFRLERRTAGVEALWEDAAQSSPHNQNGRRIVLWFAVVLGTPYLMWSLIKSILAAEKNEWGRGVGEHYVGEVNFDCKASKSDELSIKCGDKLFVAPKHKQPNVKGWLLASVNGRTGLVPANYVKIVGKAGGGQNQKNSINNNNSSNNSNNVDHADTISSTNESETCDVES